MTLKSILERCDLPCEVIDLVGVPFKDWPDRALEPWWWKGTTRAGYISAGQWHRARGLIQIDKRIVSPARPLWEAFTNTALPVKQRLAYMLRGVRETTKDDVNPAHYHLSFPKPATTRKNNKRVKAIPDVVDLMEVSNFWPSTVEELLARWPELKSYPKEDLDATIRVTSLS